MGIYTDNLEKMLCIIYMISKEVEIKIKFIESRLPNDNTKIKFYTHLLNQPSDKKQMEYINKLINHINKKNKWLSLFEKPHRNVNMNIKDLQLRPLSPLRNNKPSPKKIPKTSIQTKKK